MPLLPAPRPGEPKGDHQRRRARYGLILLIAASLAAVALFARLEALWPAVAALEGTPFLLAATLLGAGLAGAPLLALTGLVLAVWNGVESVYQPRSRATPLADRLIIALSLAVWCAPSLALVAAAARAIAAGRIHFSRPPRDYVLATDPVAFWQGVGFWLIVAAALAYLAWRYWRGKFAPPSGPSQVPEA
jgi:hypothetical protein